MLKEALNCYFVMIESVIWILFCPLLLTNVVLVYIHVSVWSATVYNMSALKIVSLSVYI